MAVTLQFISRITRKGDDKTIGEATVVTNIADPEAERKLGDLYAEGADWDKIIKRLSEERIEQELRLQDVVAGLKSKGTLHNQLSLWNLRPRFSTQIYRTRCLAWSPTLYTQVLKSKDESWYALDEAQNLLVAVVHREEPVDWGNYQTLRAPCLLDEVDEGADRPISIRVRSFILNGGYFGAPPRVMMRTMSTP